jgi:Cft2 family RNA processing exonuclease
VTPVCDDVEDDIPSFAPPEPAAPVVAAPPARVTVLGGGGLGASAYLIEHAGLRVVLDCGVDSQGRHPPLPAAVDAVIVSHAHADHMGGVPDLLRAQPGCRVYCSKPTKLLMLDQANAVGKFIPGDRVLVRDPGETYRILDGAIELTLSRVAHCLGSCAVRLRFADGLTIVYSGDLGGSGLRTLREAPPLPLGGAHAVLLESTLGDRARSRGSYSEQLLREVAAVVAEDGCAVFPATSVGRAQELAALLAEGMASGVIPAMPVRMSPLARRVLERYRAGDRDGWLADVDYPEVVDLPGDVEPEDIVAEPGYVIASGASGLQGRARLLVLAAAARKNCGVFFTSYSGPNARQRTRGDLLEVVEDDGRVISTTIVSRWQWIPSPDHPNGEELAAAVSSLGRDVPILLVHGNEEPKRRLADRLRGAGHRDVRALGDGDRVTVAAE